MDQEQTLLFVVRTWASAILAGSFTTGIIFSFSGGIECFVITFFILFFALTRGIFSLLLFYIFTYFLNKWLPAKKIKIFILAFLAGAIGLTNIILFLYGNKLDRLFKIEFSEAAIIFSFVFSAIGATYLFRNTLYSPPEIGEEQMPEIEA